MNERDRDRDRGERGERGDRGDRDFDDRGGRGGRRRGTKKKVDPFIADKTLKVDWRDPILLGRFISDRGKIVPRRVSGVTAKNQRKLKIAIKRARQAALLPYGGHRVPLRNL
ncbi:MAG: 30S ribosomal protein S18 [Deltaproteobacteria bacterium]|nr:30S ribosomal protein S18 [Deltaproteobacteria bacterium]